MRGICNFCGARTAPQPTRTEAEALVVRHIRNDHRRFARPDDVDYEEG